MEIGLVLGPVYPSTAEMSSERAFAMHMEFGKRASESGFDGFSINHHYLVGPEAQCFQPIPLAGLLLSRFPNMYVATTIFILSYHNPVEIAEQVATLDQIAPGKLILGVGQGYRAIEAQAAGISHSDRPRRMIEAIEAMRLLWSDGPATFEGAHFSFHEADIGLRPTKPSGPPILVAADKVRTVARIPKIGGDHWLSSGRHSHAFLREAVPAYKRSLEEVGREFRGLPMARDVCLADDERAAEKVIERSYARMLNMQSGWGQPGERYDLPFEQLKADRIILGSADQVAEGLLDLHRKYGAEFVWIRVYTPGMEPAVALEMVTRIGEEVLPLIRKESGRTSFFAGS